MVHDGDEPALPAEELVHDNLTATEVQDGSITAPGDVVKDAQHLMQLLVQWHMRGVATLKHMQEMPEGTMSEFEGKRRRMKGIFREGFNLGVTVALAELGRLPFAVEYEKTDTPENSSSEAVSKEGDDHQTPA